MISFDQICVKAKQAFPKLQIKFKNESLFMKILGIMLFFNPNFTTKYITTIGSTVYFPDKEYIDKYNVTSCILLMHELVHIYDSNKRNDFIYSLLYLIPQIFVICFIPLLFIFSWKIALLSLIFLLPLPAYFRMLDERKAYTFQIYVQFKLNKQYGYNINLESSKQFCTSQFKNFGYYCMWPFNSINKYFDDALNEIVLNNRPFYEQELYDIIDKIIAE